MNWWIEYEPSPGERPKQNAWSLSGHETQQEAYEKIENLLAAGCVVHLLRTADNRVNLTEAEIAAKFGLPKKNRT